MKTLLGIDLGVTFVKAGLYDTQSRCLCSAKEASPGEHGGKEAYLQNADDYLRAAVRVISRITREMPEESKAVSAVTFSGLMAGAVGIDEKWNDITTLSTNMDSRYTPYVEKMISTNRVGMSSISGTNYPYWGAKLLWWKEEYPELYERVHKFMFLAGYIMGKLCGIEPGDAAVDRTYLEMSGLADMRENSWSEELCESFSLDVVKLPKIVDSCDIVGYLSGEAASACGLVQGTPVVAGAGDKPSGALGAGVVEPGMMVDESASFGALSLCSDTFCPDTEYGTLEMIPAPIKGLYYPTSFLLGSGISVSWFLKTFGEKDFSLLEQKIEALPPGSDGLLSIGLLDGRAYPCDPKIRGMWMGHTWGHKKEHFYRALLESYAYEYKYFLSVLKILFGLNITEIRVIGGGAESDVWNRIKTDVLGVPYFRTGRNDHALLGNIIMGGKAVGIYSDLRETAKTFCSTVKIYDVDKENHRRYDKFYHLYLNAIDKNRKLFASLSGSR